MSLNSHRVGVEESDVSLAPRSMLRIVLLRIDKDRGCILRFLEGLSLDLLWVNASYFEGHVVETMIEEEGERRNYGAFNEFREG